MTERIVAQQTDIPGVELIYLEHLDAAGIHVRGLAKLLGCNPSTIFNALGTVHSKHVLGVEMQTVQGLRTVQFILEPAVIQILEDIQDSQRVKKETSNAARRLYRQFAIAGFKLYTMLKVAPHKLKEKVDAHVAEMELFAAKAKLEELRAIANQSEHSLLEYRQWVNTALPESSRKIVLGFKEITRVEYRDRVIREDEVLSDGSTIQKTELCYRYSFLTKNGKPDYARLNGFLSRLPVEAFGKTLIVRENMEMKREALEKLDELVQAAIFHQGWIGENPPSLDLR